MTAICFRSAVLIGCLLVSIQTSIAGTPRRLALLVGINDYVKEEIPDLAGAVNDVTALGRILNEQFQFDKKDVVILTDSQATRKGILAAFEQHLIDQATTDTVVYFHFSGYGSRIADVNGEEGDGFDETLVPHDGRQEGIFDITDDEQDELFGRLSAKTPHIVAVFDCGFANIRERPADRSRGLPVDTRTPNASPIAPAARFIATSRPTTASKSASSPVARIFASQEGDLVFEHRFADQDNGYLSRTWSEELRAAAGKEQCYRDVMDRVVIRMRILQRGQKPSLGNGTAADDVVFSTKHLPTDPYFLAAMSGLDVWINAGRLQGLRSGVQLSVFPPATHLGGQPLKPIAIVTLDVVGDDQSIATLNDTTPIPPASRIRVPETTGMSDKIPVFVNVGTFSSPLLERLRRQITASPAFEVVDQPATSRFVVKRTMPWSSKLEGELEITDAVGKHISSVSELQPEAAEHVIQQMLKKTEPLPDLNSNVRQVFIDNTRTLPGKIHALFVGIDEYDIGFTLHGCVNDAKSLSEALKPVTATHLELFNEKATKGAILDQVENLARIAQTGDLLVLMFSCHGASEYDDFYLLPHDFDNKRILSTGVQFTILTDALSSRGVKTLFIIDSCHSGGSGFNIARYRTSDYGATVMVSCSKDELSHEGPFGDQVRGFFTGKLVAGFGGEADEDHNNQITIRELFDFAYSGTKQISRGTQHPLFFGSLDQNIVVRTLPGPAVVVSR